ncbi:MAG: class I SAM-dependent rRNA methyltransferase [Bacteroidetes bacterium]|nr:class I SAM-dependent rRNA methyltransferase [Bacteroidota bacterium]
MQKSFSKIILKKGKERSLLNMHPWLFSGAVEKTDAGISEGDIVEIHSFDQKYLATGHYHEGSIKVRIFSFSQTAADYEFWKEKIEKAYLLRKQLGFTDDPGTNVYRLVHAEGDGLPGLIIDIYDTTAVIQTHTLGMHRVKNFLVDALKEIYRNRLTAVYDKSAESMSKQENTIAENSFLFGSEKNIEVTENGIRFFVDIESGQKTGFFIDQRENRKLLGTYSSGKKVLNTFAYSGGFSLYSLKAGAELVHSVDSSKKAAELAEKNVALNFTNVSHAFYAEDVFGFLKKSETVYDVMVLDPPAFAKHLSSVDKATIGYRNLNYEAMKRINKNGILFTFSCSQVIDKNLFRKIVFMAALQAKRNVRILHQLTQPPDHPVSIYHPEGEYLKGLVLFVE